MALQQPPVVGNAIAQAALDLATDVPGGPPNVRVTRSAKRRKIANGLLMTGAITEAEYGDHELFQANCTAAAAGGGGVPAWFAPAMANALAPINANLANINANLANINANLANINANLVNINARQSNAVAVHQSHPLAVLNNAAGNPDPNFPDTLQALNNMTGPQLTAILGFYGLPVAATVEERRARFKAFIGIRP